LTKRRNVTKNSIPLSTASTATASRLYNRPHCKFAMT
jgi:hypothetical protein